MPKHDHVEALRLIEKAILAMQARYHPGRPMYSTMGRLRDQVREARHDAAAAARTYARD
jgi:hypothetical protein